LPSTRNSGTLPDSLLMNDQILENIIFKSLIGMSGFIATFELNHINEILGALVGLATLIYMTASAVKVIRELRDK